MEVSGTTPLYSFLSIGGIMRTYTHHPSLVRDLDHTVIGGRLRKFRVLAGYTQIDLAQRAGLCYVTIHAAETGKTLPWPVTMAKLCKVLKCNISDLYGDSPAPHVKPKH